MNILKLLICIMLLFVTIGCSNDNSATGKSKVQNAKLHKKKGGHKANLASEVKKPEIKEAKSHKVNNENRVGNVVKEIKVPNTEVEDKWPIKDDYIFKFSLRFEENNKKLIINAKRKGEDIALTCLKFPIYSDSCENCVGIKVPNTDIRYNASSRQLGAKNFREFKDIAYLSLTEIKEKIALDTLNNNTDENIASYRFFNALETFYRSDLQYQKVRKKLDIEIKPYPGSKDLINKAKMVWRPDNLPMKDKLLKGRVQFSKTLRIEYDNHDMEKPKIQAFLKAAKYLEDKAKNKQSLISDDLKIVSKHINKVLENNDLNHSHLDSSKFIDPAGKEAFGEFRLGMMKKGKVTFIHERYVKSEVERILCEIENRIEKKEDPIITANYAIWSLISVHAFKEGNGRVGLLLGDYVLARYSLPPLSFLKEVSNKGISAILYDDEEENTISMEDLYKYTYNAFKLSVKTLAE